MPSTRPTGNPTPAQLQPNRAVRHLARGATLRCPNCGSGGLFRRWVVMEPSCPGCHLKLDRGEADYFLGAYTINFVAAELLIVIGAGLGIWWMWPDVSWDWIMWGLILLMIPIPILFYPFAKTLWLAIDLTFRPLTLADLEGHGENRPPAPQASRDPSGS